MYLFTSFVFYLQSTSIRVLQSFSNSFLLIKCASVFVPDIVIFDSKTRLADYIQLMHSFEVNNVNLRKWWHQDLWKPVKSQFQPITEGLCLWSYNNGRSWILTSGYMLLHPFQQYFSHTYMYQNDGSGWLWTALWNKEPFELFKMFPFVYFCRIF